MSAITQEGQRSHSAALDFFFTLAAAMQMNSVRQKDLLQLPMPVSPSGVSGISAFPFRTCRSLDEL